jgi:hypothetical protein
VAQPRDRRLFEALAVMRIADREQAKIVAGFGSTTRVNARLLALTRVGLLRRFFLGTGGGGQKALYALSEKAARMVEAPRRGPRRKQGEAIVADYFIEHQLRVNEMYCALKYGTIPVADVAFRRWHAFHESVAETVRLIPDGLVEFDTPSGTLAAFLEVDLGQEGHTVWKEKVRNYLRFALSGEFELRFKVSRFRVLILANSERRMHLLRKTVAAMTPKVFWFASLAAIRNQGFFASVWFRPTGDLPKPFIGEHS